MSKSMFANPKAALGFAGVTIAIAIGASFAASHLLPSAEEAGPVAAQTEEAGPQEQANRPAAAVAWADEGSDGGFSDDWNDSAVDTASDFNNPSASSDANEMEQPDFGDYAPQSRETPRDRAGSAPPRTRSASSSPGPRIRSGASSDAPALQPPGGGGSGELVQVD